MKQLSENASENKRMLLLGAAALLLGVLFQYFFYEEGMGPNFPLFIFMVVIGGLSLASAFGKRVTKDHYFVIGSSILFSIMVFVRSSELLSFWNVCATFFLLLTGVSLFAGKHLRALLLLDYLTVPFLPFRFIAPFFETFAAIVALRGMSGERARTREIVRGSLMAVIALVIFTALLASADAGFNQLLSNMFSFDIDQTILHRLFLGTLGTAFFIGGFGFMFKKLHPNQAPEAPAKPRSLGLLETTILFGAINALFAAFILLQVSYLFGGGAHLIASGLTYAEYAREGFIQLLWVAALSFVVIAFAERVIVQHEGVHSPRFKFLSGTLVALVIAILISAWNRLSLYEHAYGFTDIRLYSRALMVWVGVMLILLSIHIWKSDKRQKFIFRAFVSVVVLLLSMNLLNPDAFIAKQNLARYHATGNIDAWYLGTLSTDALPYTVGLLNDPSEAVRKDFAGGFAPAHQCLLGDCTIDKAGRSWKSTRIGVREAKEMIAPYRGFILLHAGGSSL